MALLTAHDARDEVLTGLDFGHSVRGLASDDRLMRCVSLGVLPIWTFVAVTLPLVLTPGLSTAVVLRNSVAGGVRAGLETAVGINAGSFCYGLVSAFGVVVALERWPGAWTVVRGAGVVYVGWLGLQSLGRAWEGAGARLGVGGPERRRSVREHLYEGFVTNLLNPAIAAFYLVILPQFVPRGAPIAASVLELTAIHIGLALSWHAVWAAASGTLANTLATGRPRRALEAIAGLTLLGLAVRLALG